MITQSKKRIYRFDEGDAGMRDLLGGKGANLAEMARLGLPVPPGFTITTEACREYYEAGNRLPEGLWQDIREHMRWLEQSIGREFGSTSNPLLVSVRSGARDSMPGMMDTILNLGINEDVAQGLAGLMGDERPAYDVYRRFLQIFGSVVLGVESSAFEDILTRHKDEAGVHLDSELSPVQLHRVVADFKQAIREDSGQEVPQDPWQQLSEAIQAVFRSWNSPRAVRYRDHYGIPHDWGTAVNVMVMVFGNLGDCVRLQPRRRRREVSEPLSEGRNTSRQSFRNSGPRRGRRAHSHGPETGAADSTRPGGGHLRRARW